MTQDKALDRVRKLLALSEHAGSEHEAATAAAKAAAMMEQFQLTEALVRLDDPEAKPEAIVKDARLDAADRTKKRVAWKETIALAVAADLGLRMYWWGSDVCGFGRESATQTWRYTCSYLFRAVDELCAKAVAAADIEVGWHHENERGATRAWANAFRLGCASRLAVRIAEGKHEREQAARSRKAAVMESMQVHDETPDAARESLALTVIEKDHVEVQTAYKAYSSKWKRTIGGIGQTSSSGGYQAGRAAGDRVKLGGGGRGALAAGQGRLKP